MAGRIPAGRIGFGGGAPLRAGAAGDPRFAPPRFAPPRAAHPGALWLAAAAPLAATLLLLAARIGG